LQDWEDKTVLRYLLAVVVILLLMLGWTGAQRLARRYASRHPEFGPAREDGAGCGGCGCRPGECRRDD
jgi:hypothetical protein